MITRLRRTVAAWLVHALDKDDALTLLGLLLVSGGLWAWSHALAAIVPGVILLWVFLPPRPPFVEAPTRSPRRVVS